MSATHRVCEGFENLNFLINCACRSTAKRVEDLTAERFNCALHAKITAAFLLLRVAAHRIGDRGAMLFFSLTYSQIAPEPERYHPPLNPSPSEYGASKAAIKQMTS